MVEYWILWIDSSDWIDWIGWINWIDWIECLCSYCSSICAKTTPWNLTPKNLCYEVCSNVVINLNSCSKNVLLLKTNSTIKSVLESYFCENYCCLTKLDICSCECIITFWKFGIWRQFPEITSHILCWKNMKGSKKYINYIIKCDWIN